MRRKILIIDDDRLNLDLLEKNLYLSENKSHNIIRASNGKEGWEKLNTYANEIDVILLDRKMPIMNGDEFMSLFNQNESLKSIPVVMQTFCAEPEEIRNGFKLGVYHYLTKPYMPDMLNSVVSAAISFYTRQTELQFELQNSKNLFKYTEQSIYKINHLNDIKIISLSLAQMFPEPAKVILGISEIITNAIEHGNIGITYDEKTQLNIQCAWQAEVLRRLKLPENVSKSVLISYSKTKSEIILNITDEGNGFDFQKYLTYDPKRSTDNHGRGIAFANKQSFDCLEYLGCGNSVNCIVKLNDMNL